MLAHCFTIVAYRLCRNNCDSLISCSIECVDCKLHQHEPEPHGHVCAHVSMM